MELMGDRICSTLTSKPPSLPQIARDQLEPLVAKSQWLGLAVVAATAVCAILPSIQSLMAASTGSQWWPASLS